MRPVHWLYTIPLRLRSLFIEGRQTKSWTTSCATTSNEKSMNMSRKG